MTASKPGDSQAQLYESGRTLREFMKRHPSPSPELFLDLARAIAASVEALHRGRILHLDLRPERILIPAAGEGARLSDSGYAVQRGAEGYVRPAGLGLPEAGLPYCSPENTGRMQRAIDERSDLYSLGVIFYEMLTGHPPFFADNPLEWVYLHLAQSPPPLTNQGIPWPDGLAAIVMKLLEKNPDNRYPSAAFLIAELDKIGRPPDTFAAEASFHGREAELSTLTQAFYSICLGSTEMVYVSGEAGIGKTSLIDELFRKQLHSRDFYYITGKFEQFANESPYHPIIQAFRGLIRHLLGERHAPSWLWRTKLREALGANVPLMASMIPEIGLLIGDIPTIDELPTDESKKRFLYVFRKFVKALATKERPIVLFIDDVQWANSSSLELIHALLCDAEVQYLLLVCAYRHMETDRTRLPGYDPDGTVSNQAVVRHIHLAPFSLEQMNRLAAETLSNHADSSLSFTELIYHNSGGNPFHFKQILHRLQDDRVLLYNHQKRGWQWDLGRMIERESSYAISDLMAHRLQRLSAEAQELLQAAACVGSSFSVRLIAAVVKRETEATLADWAAIEADGMIVPLDAGEYRFAHDQIQKLIYSGMEEAVREDFHLRIGRGMSELEERLGEPAFETVNQLNRGSRSILDARERRQLASMNLDAGNRAKASSAYDVALGYYRMGTRLLSANDWNEAFELIFELHAQQAECEYLCGHSKSSEQLVELLLDRARNPVERSKVQLIRIMQCINQGRYLEGTALGLDSLRELHIFIAPTPGKAVLFLEGLRIEALLRQRYDRLSELKEMSDPEKIAAMNLIFAIVASSFFTDKKVYFLILCRAIQLSLKYGNTPVSAAIYSAYGMVLGNSSGKFENGYAIGKVGVELSERYNIDSIKSKTYTMYGGVLCQFAGNAREGESYLAKALRCGMDSGDYVYASYAIGAHVNSLYTRASLGELARAIADYMAVLDTTHDEFVRQNLYLYQQWMLALEGRTAAPDSFSGQGFEEETFLARISQEETSSTTLFQYHTYKAQLCYLLGRWEEAFRWAQQAAAYETYATHLPHLPECLFYKTLAALSLSVQTPLSAAGRRSLSRDLRRFKHWASISPVNYRSRMLLLQAELARVSGHAELAEARYDEAIREAREQGHPQVISLAGELAASHYRRRGLYKSAIAYLELALEGYAQWGVPLKSKQLKALLSSWEKEKSADPAPGKEQLPTGRESAASTVDTASSPADTATADSFDLTALLRTTQAISKQMDMDTVLAEIMSTLLQHAGASKGAMLTESQDTLRIQAYADVETRAVPFPSELQDSTLLPEGIIRYVFRTQENVHYNGGEASWLNHNPYMAKHRPQSALCVPITVHGTMLGVLYLENRLADGVFVSDRMAVLLAIASQGMLMCVLQSANETTYSGPGLEDETSPSPGRMEEPLTERELEVLSLLAAGLTNKEISDRLIIAVGTVKVHVKNIFAKLKVNRRFKAIEQAKELRLLGQDEQRS